MSRQELQFDEEHLARVDVCLESLLMRSKGIAVLFANSDGQPMGQVGGLSDKDKIALSTLAAGSFAASAAMARIFGRVGAFDQLFFEGQEYSVYSSAVGDGFLLTIAFDSMAKPGLVRLLAQETVTELRGIVRGAREQAMEQSLEELIDSEFGDSLADELDSLLSEGDKGAS